MEFVDQKNQEDQSAAATAFVCGEVRGREMLSGRFGAT